MGGGEEGWNRCEMGYVDIAKTIDAGNNSHSQKQNIVVQSFLFKFFLFFFISNTNCDHDIWRWFQIQNQI